MGSPGVMANADGPQRVVSQAMVGRWLHIRGNSEFERDTAFATQTLVHGRPDDAERGTLPPATQVLKPSHRTYSCYITSSQEVRLLIGTHQIAQTHQHHLLTSTPAIPWLPRVH